MKIPYNIGNTVNAAKGSLENLVNKVSAGVVYSGTPESIAALKGLVNSFDAEHPSTLKTYDLVNKLVCEGGLVDVTRCYQYVEEASDALNDNGLQISAKVDGKLLKAASLGVKLLSEKEKAQESMNQNRKLGYRPD